MPKSCTTAELLGHFEELISEVSAHGEEILVMRSGLPVARILPPLEKTITVREICEIWRETDLSDNDTTFADDLEKVQKADSPATPPWPS